MKWSYEDYENNPVQFNEQIVRILKKEEADMKRQQRQQNLRNARV